MVQIKESENLFYVGENPQNRSAELVYSLAGSLMTILHTEVSESLRGQGVAQQLVAYAVDFARQNQLKIIPLCSYAVKQFEKYAEYRDVLFP